MGPGDAHELDVRYQLSGGRPGTQFVALVAGPVSYGGPADRVTFKARGDRPMRLSVRIRNRAKQADQWAQSIYVTPTEADYTVFLDRMTPVADTRAPQPAPSGIQDVIFVVETTHAKPGSSGSFSVADPALEGSTAAR